MSRCYIFLILFVLLLLPEVKAQDRRGPQGEVFSVRIVKEHLSDPWEVTYGPDDHLWITEAKSYQLGRINPQTGDKTVLLDLSSERNFPRYDQEGEEENSKPWPQGGLMGMALHPDLLHDKPFVYLAYVYNFEGANHEGDGCEPNYGGCYFSTKIVRYEYDPESITLANPMTICDTIPGSDDHNSGRMTIGTMEGTNYLFYTVGDMGAGQYDNMGRQNNAQRTDVYEGKVLRFLLEPDEDTDPYERWIPDDNPFNTEKQNAVWSYGHRNAQGIVFAITGGTGKLYSSEHGPFSDDEINIIEKGKNYGHPFIIGYPDNNYNGLSGAASKHEWLPGEWNTSLPTIGKELEHAEAIGPEHYRAPIYSFLPSDNQFLRSIMSEIKEGEEEEEPSWPAYPPGSIDVYTSEAIPGWKNSLLIPVLKKGSLIRLPLSPSGDAVGGPPSTYFLADMRYRDLAISADGLKLYVAVDSTDETSGPSEEQGENGDNGSTCRGCILEFTYEGQQQALRQETEPMPTGRLLQELRETVQAMDRQERQAKREELSATQKILFDLLSAPEVIEEELNQLKGSAQELLEELNKEKDRE